MFLYCIKILLRKGSRKSPKMSRNSKNILGLFWNFFMQISWAPGSRAPGSLFISHFRKKNFHFVFASLRGCHSHGIGLHRIGSIYLASPFFACRGPFGATWDCEVLQWILEFRKGSLGCRRPQGFTDSHRYCVFWAVS
jgi:hypothetical protein